MFLFITVFLWLPEAILERRSVRDPFAVATVDLAAMTTSSGDLWVALQWPAAAFPLPPEATGLGEIRPGQSSVLPIHRRYSKPLEQSLPIH